MKRIIGLTTLFVLFALVFSGCEKKKEWTRVYDITNEVVIGSYSYSNVENAFEGLTENDNFHLCYDAQISLKQTTGNLVKFRFKSERTNFNVAVEDNLLQEEGDFKIFMSNASCTVTAYVYRNEKNQTRLHGFVSKKDSQLVGYVNYYFDVIKDAE